MQKVKIGLLPLYVKLYDDSSPSMRPWVEQFADTVANTFAARNDVEVVRCEGICRLESEFEAAVKHFEAEQVDSIVTLHLAYSPSLESERILKETKLPIVILDTTPAYDFTRSKDIWVVTFNHGIHGVQDMCNLLVRNKKEFYIEAGHYLYSDVMDRVVKRVQGIKAANEFRKAKVGTIGGGFDGMGDFLISDEAFKELGIEKVAMTAEDIANYAAQITKEEVEELLASDREKYVVAEDLTEEELTESAKGSLVVRKWLEEHGCSAFTANFLAITKAFGLPGGMPFAEANRAMERGVGYAGEGDVLTAALVGALMTVSDQTSFVEMFCPDWSENMIFLSHMGEMNTALAEEKPKFLRQLMEYTDIDTTWTCGTFKAGEATLIDLAPVADGKLRVIASKVDMKLPMCDKLHGSSTCGWFDPNQNIGTFLENYSKLGGTHHLSLMYGDMRKLAEAFAKEMGFEYCEI